MEFDKKKLLEMVQKKLQELIDSDELVDHESIMSVKGKAMPEEGKGLTDLLKMFGGGKAEIEIEAEEKEDEMEGPECPMCGGEGCPKCADESGVSSKNKKMIMMALSKK
jgi:hypothetical protein